MLKYDIIILLCQIIMKEKLSSIIEYSKANQYQKGMDYEIKEKVEKKKLLLHSCCGPCSTSCIERLVNEYYITVFFYNPNITDLKEYEKRKETQIKFINSYNLKLEDEKKIKYIEGEYNPSDYFDFVKGLENEKEGGKRCTECFKLRLHRTAEVAKDLNFDYFATTLTVSPHKNSPLISLIGNVISNELKIAYLDMDFKKKDGYKRSIELSKEYDLYRQNYCGCEFSKWFIK